MKRRRSLLLVPVLVLLGLAAPHGTRAATPHPAWSLRAAALPANFAPGATPIFLIIATNVGGAPTTGPVVLSATLPEPLQPIKVDFSTPAHDNLSCAISGRQIECETADPVRPGRFVFAKVKLEVPAATPPGALTLPARVSGGGIAEADVQTEVPVESASVPFGFLPDFAAPLSEADGSPAAGAGSHPYQLTVGLDFPTEVAGFNLTGTEHLRDVLTELPRGLLGDPAASPVLCTEAQLLTILPGSKSGCPDASAVGTFDLITLVGGNEGTSVITSPLYDMVPPPGAPAELATDAGGVGLFVHLIASVRSDGDYGISTTGSDLLAIANPIFGADVQLWGDPSSPAHDAIRGNCAPHDLGTCPMEEPQATAFLTMPADCPGSPPTTRAAADSWEQPGAVKQTSYLNGALDGSPVSIAGCGALAFHPTLTLTPTSNLADSPTGLDVDLHQPQDFDNEHTATAELKDATVTLPEGLVANPSQADGLGACSEEEIGYLAEAAAEGIHFSKSPQSCPQAAKIGTVEVTTPLLVRRNSAHRLETDPETGLPIPEPLHGSVYIAKPFANPFGSLLAIYLAVEDPKTGTIAKLAGRVEPDPQTGRLTTVFEENPELPLEDVRLHLFAGARASLTSPPVCGSHTTTTTLVPWSDSEGGVPIAGADAHPQSSFETTASPAGGACPTEAAKAPHRPAFEAGTVSPQAGAYSPFVLRLSREDGSQRLTGIETMLPPGLTGKLAGIAECSAAGLAQAISREAPEQGIVEMERPSCPASSEVGTVDVAAGSGPAPFHATGRAYLAGPYKGAPLSLAIITPAIAGPFDLGTVVVRTALFVDPFTAQIHAVSDPFPQILDGIPLDIRSIALRMDRPDFTLNPTSCDPFSITGGALSATGQTAPVSQRFQVGGCSSLKFKPRLTISLKGPTKRTGHPALKAVLTYPGGPGYTNIGGAQVTLPGSEFLDQGNLNKVCTRPELESRSCPASSVYGKAKAWTPLLDAPLEGPVYLGVGFGYKLPALVAELGGQIRVLLKGKVDTGPGHGIRNTFEAVPDAPVSRFVIELKGGKKYGLLENSTNVCRAPQRATARFTGQDGAVVSLKPLIRNSCGKKGHGHKKGHDHKKHHKGHGGRH
jgi:hypothetical protein